MNAIEQVLKEAIENGKYAPVGNQFCEGNCWREGHRYCKYTFFMDPAFWQCLGKARGWLPNSDEEITAATHKYGYKHYWHSLIDHLASGGTAESFFASLV